MIMAKTKQQKEQTVQAYAEKLKQAKGVVFANFAGLNVKAVVELRNKCREQNVDYVVAKKTLMGFAFKAAGLEGIDTKMLPGSVATVFGRVDEVSAANVIGQFSKTHDALQPIGGILERRFIDGATVIQLSKLPSKQELLAKVAGSLQAPISGFVNVLAGNLRGLVGVLQAIKNSKA